MIEALTNEIERDNNQVTASCEVDEIDGDFLDNEVGRAHNSTTVDEILDVMTEIELEETIINENEIYEFVMTDGTYIVEEDGIGEISDEDNLESLMDNLNLNVELNAEINFVKTSRNGRKLLHAGFSYVRDRGEFECIQWKFDFVLTVTKW